MRTWHSVTTRFHDSGRVEARMAGARRANAEPKAECRELPYDEAAWHDLADIEDDDLRAAKQAEINELLNGGRRRRGRLKNKEEMTMTKNEHAKLIKMQKSNPVPTDKVLEALWEIGGTAEIGRICCYQEMLREIMLSTEVSPCDKNRALDIFQRWAYTNGRKDERRDTGHALGTSWFEA
jgi:hypothetical protein